MYLSSELWYLRSCVVDKNPRVDQLTNHGVLASAARWSTDIYPFLPASPLSPPNIIHHSFGIPHNPVLNDGVMS